ncbi:19005_t:CDS:2 [Dentiscutata erythropus]|uniref:19005_t:CDS:1 n=1 Tax=Dentiscutata erythropus TaxID=1348616 RepID=A0A9N8WBM9_9GLOM|nr:19005_t:CDS:2 [Dentiscutata erythropus]
MEVTISKEEDVTEKAEADNSTETAVSAIESETQQASTVPKQQQNRELVENTEPKTPEKQPEIRLDIPLTSRYNNIVYFPDLLKEAGYAIAKTPPRYMSCSETPGSETPQSEWSDFETPDDFRTPTPPSAIDLPRAFRDENDEFFDRILENAGKYAIVEEEKTRKKKRRIIKKEQHYDVNDPFIDDSELAPLQRDYGKVRPQIEGFFVWNGPLVLERLVDEDEPSSKKKAAKRKPKSSETDGPKVRKARTVKKAEGGSDGKGKAATPKKRVSKKLKTAGDTNQESSSMNGVVSTSHNETNPSNNSHITDPSSSTNISTIGANNTSAHQKDLSDPNKSSGKKKKVYPVDPVHPDVQYLLDLFKQQVDKESFEVKSRFPQNLKPPLMELLSRAYELNQFNENLFKILTNTLPYNKFTITRLCQRTLYPKSLIELQKRKLEFIGRLKVAVDEIMPSLLQEFDERNASVSSSSVPVNGDNSAEIDSNMEIDGDADIEPDADADGDIKSDSKSDSSSNNNRSKETVNGKKFRWDENTRFLLWKIVQEEMSWVVMSNCLAEAEEKSERHSEQTRRKSLYQYLLTLWPKGWMTSYEIARVYSAYKRYLRDRPNSS